MIHRQFRHFLSPPSGEVGNGDFRVTDKMYFRLDLNPPTAGTIFAALKSRMKQRTQRDFGVVMRTCRARLGIYLSTNDLADKIVRKVEYLIV